MSEQLWSDDRFIAELSEHSAAHKNDWNAALELGRKIISEYEGWWLEALFTTEPEAQSLAKSMNDGEAEKLKSAYEGMGEEYIRYEANDRYMVMSIWLNNTVEAWLQRKRGAEQ